MRRQNRRHFPGRPVALRVSTCFISARGNLASDDARVLQAANKGFPSIASLFRSRPANPLIAGFGRFFTAHAAGRRRIVKSADSLFSLARKRFECNFEHPMLMTRLLGAVTLEKAAYIDGRCQAVDPEQRHVRLVGGPAGMHKRSSCKTARRARNHCSPFFILKPRRTFRLCLSVCSRFVTRRLESSC